jgi:hypothetical protein
VITASNGRWRNCSPANAPASAPASAASFQECARIARNTAVVAATPRTNESWYESSVADCTHANGDAHTISALSTATRRSRVSSIARSATPITPEAADSARSGTDEPNTASDTAIIAGHTGWYLNTMRSSWNPERKGRKNGSCVARGRVSSPSRSAFACDWYATSSRFCEPSGRSSRTERMVATAASAATSAMIPNDRIRPSASETPLSCRIDEMLGEDRGLLGRSGREPVHEERGPALRCSSTRRRRTTPDR